MPKKLPEQTGIWRPGQSLLVPTAEPQRNVKGGKSAAGTAIQTDYELPADMYPDDRVTRNPNRSAIIRNQPIQTAGDFTVRQGNKRIVYHGSTPIPARTNAPGQNLGLPQPTQQPYPFDTNSSAQGSRKAGVVLLIIGLAMALMLVGWIVLTYFFAWWQVKQDDWYYGRPRTAQYDVAVGHTDSVLNKSHFIALNIKSHVEIIEFPGGDTLHARIYQGPTLLGIGSDLAPVTLEFKDVTGDGKPDMLIHVQDSVFVFINDNGTFRPARPGEKIYN